MVDAVLFLFVAFVILGTYFLPAIIAACRRLKNEGSIMVINLFFGWTMLGWVIALAMAVSGTAAKKEAR